MFSATDVIPVFGKRGSGKSTLAKEIQKLFPRLIILDRLHEYPKIHCKNEWIVETWDGFCQAIRATATEKAFRIVFRFDIEATNHDEVFNHVLRVIYYRGSACVVIEEVHNFATAHHLPQWFREILLTGRHRGLALITTSQRPAECHKTLISQAHHIFCGTLHEKNDVNYVQGVMGDAALQLSTLKPFHFLHFNPPNPPTVINNRIKKGR